MPLLDHFRAPIYPSRPWDSFHSRWANAIADALNEQLPEQFIAEVQTQLGTHVEADVAEIAHDEFADDGGSPVAVKSWAPPKATMVVPAIFPDSFEVQIRDQLLDARVVAAVELVSPGNKDRPESRRLFAAKTASYLQAGVGLVVVDIVSIRKLNLFEEMLSLLSIASTPMTSPLYAIACRPIRRGESSEIEIWAESLNVGDSLPTLPLALLRGPVVPLDLEASYELARERARL